MPDPRTDERAKYYGRDGTPMAFEKWAESFGEPEAKRVARTTVGEVNVSTVWLGLDHSFGGGPPLIFETMIFGGRHSEEQWRYSTEEEALTGHRAAVDLVRSDRSEAPS